VTTERTLQTYVPASPETYFIAPSPVASPAQSYNPLPPEAVKVRELPTHTEAGEGKFGTVGFSIVIVPIPDTAVQPAAFRACTV
jgi:hypothetical protein